MASASSPITSIRLRVAELEAQRRFYTAGLGLEVLREGGGELVLGPPGGGFEVVLAHRPDAVARPRPSIGLFHVAYLVPDRRSLAEVLAHLHERGVTIEGMADHGVSEALYLSDAEGNGLELYRDRPPEAWPREGDEVAMVTDPLDVRDLLGQAQAPSPLPEGTRIGHVHLHVPDLDAAEGFFGDGLGLRVRQRGFPGALFLAEDDYHHHVGVNTWAGDQQAPKEAIGLESYTWRGKPKAVASRLRSRGVEVEDGDGWIAARDPAGVELRVESAT